MIGLIGKKRGMISTFDSEGVRVPCSIIELGPCVVTQIKSSDSDGYEAIQLGFGEKKEKHVNAPEKGHFTKAETTPKRKLVEFRDWEGKTPKLGETVSLNIFQEGDFVDVAGTSKGRGFQGVVKRHGFAGVGQSSHGQHNRNRAPGSIGAASDPSRVFKGIRMGGRMGGKRVTVTNLSVIKVLEEKNLLLVKGALPGANGSYVIVTK